MTRSEVLGSVTGYDRSISNVSWGAVIGGAFVISAVSLIMLALGAGFGLSIVSPWSGAGASATAVRNAGIAWLIITQVIASALGGYLAGRWRTRWESLHGDEVHFRDTANGFLAWAVALVVTVAFLTSGAAIMAGSAADATTPMRAMQGDDASPNAYFVDRLFRSDHASTATPSDRAEASRILANALRQKDVPAADTTYLAQLVAAKTGISQHDADMRVSQTITDTRQALDNLRSATARILLWTFLALLIGAFCASYAATIGGRQRDHVRAI